jgi:hypothetical protein
MNKDTRILTTPDTITTTDDLQSISDDAERIAAEEAECWRQYNEAKKAEEARVQAEIDAAYAERGMVYTTDAAEPMREARRQRRDGKNASKERLKKNAETAAAGLDKIKKEVAKAKSATKKEQEMAAAKGKKAQRKKSYEVGPDHRFGMDDTRIRRGKENIKRAGKIKPAEA